MFAFFGGGIVNNKPLNVLDSEFYAAKFMEFLQWESATTDTIDFKRIYADMAGDVLAGLALSQIVYWYLPSKETGKKKLRVQRDGHFWIAATRDDWWEQCRLNPRQIDGALAKLISGGLIIKDHFLFDGKRTLHVRINQQGFFSLWHSLIDSPITEPRATRKRRSKSVASLESLVSEAKSESLSSETDSLNRDPITKTTSEITAKTLEEKDSSPQNGEVKTPEEIQPIETTSHSHAPQPTASEAITPFEEKADADQYNGTTPQSPNFAAPSFPANSPVSEVAELPNTQDARKAPDSVPDTQPPAKRKKRGTAGQSAMAAGESDTEAEQLAKAAYEDARLAVCYAWQMRPLELDQRGHMWVSLYANFLTGRVSKSKQGTDYDKLKITPGMTAAEIAGFRLWYLEEEQFRDQKVPPTTLATLEARVGQFGGSAHRVEYIRRGQGQIDTMKAAIARKKAELDECGDAPAPIQVDESDEAPDLTDEMRANFKALIRSTSRTLSGKQEAA